MPSTRFSRRTFLKSTIGVALASSAATCSTTEGAVSLFVGTYTSGASEGIYRLRMNTEDGSFSEPELAAACSSPSYLAIDPKRRYLFAVNEGRSFGGKVQGAVSSFEMDPVSGNLKPASKTGSFGAHPCYVSCDPEGRHILVANYSGGNIAVFPVWSAGRLGPATSFVQHEGSSINERRQAGPHAHFIKLEPSGLFAFVADLGLDRVMMYRFDSVTGKLTPADVPYFEMPPGSGPRHLDFHPNGKIIYVAGELTSTVSVFAWDWTHKQATLRETVSMLPDGFEGNNSAADIHVHPDGHTLYASNRGHDSIAVFRIAGDGSLGLVENVPIEGETPRNFVVLPDGEWLLAAGQRSDTVASFKIDAETGVPVFSGNIASVPSPVCLLTISN